MEKFFLSTLLARYKLNIIYEQYIYIAIAIARGVDVSLQGGGRFWGAYLFVHHLHVLVDRRALLYRGEGGGEGDIREHDLLLQPRGAV